MLSDNCGLVFMRILCVPFRHPQPPCPTPKGAIIVLARGGVTLILICPDVWTFLELIVGDVIVWSINCFISLDITDAIKKSFKLIL